MQNLFEEMIYSKAIEKWGREAQLQMVVEEMSELTKCICKTFRYAHMNQEDIKQNDVDLLEELADVEIMLGQLKVMYKDMLPRWRTIKSDKLRKIAKKLGLENFWEMSEGSW